MRSTCRILMVILAVSCFLLPRLLLAASITQKTKNEKFNVTMTTAEDGLSYLTLGSGSVAVAPFVLEARTARAGVVAANLRMICPVQRDGLGPEQPLQYSQRSLFLVQTVFSSVEVLRPGNELSPQLRGEHGSTLGVHVCEGVELVGNEDANGTPHRHS